MFSHVHSFISILVIFLTSNLLAQAPDTLWTKTYGGASQDMAYSATLTPEGGLMISAGTLSWGAGGEDLWVLKTDTNGDTLLTRIYGGSGREKGETIQPANDGGYIIGGFIEPLSGESLAWLVKIDADGDTVWTRTFVGFTRGVAQTLDTGYVLVGGRNGKVLIIKTDSLGAATWEKTYGDTSDAQGLSVQQTADNGYIVSGWVGDYFAAGDGARDLFLLKVAANGDSSWMKTYGGVNNDCADNAFLQITTDGGYIVAGNTESFGAGIGTGDAWLVKVDAAGDTVWTQTYGGVGEDMAISVQLTSDGGYILAGYTTSYGAGSMDGWLIKTDDLGDTLWTKTVGGTEADGFFAVQQTADGGYLAAGGTWGVGSGDVWLVRFGDPTAQSTTPAVAGVPEAFALHANYPNPFNPSTTIGFDLPAAAVVTLTVYDILGREMVRLANRQMGAGYHQATWDGRTGKGAAVPTGIYFARIRAAEHSRTIKMLLLK